MYFGTREHMTDVRCPAINVVRNREKWTTSGTYLNGGGFSRASAYSHATYSIGWNLMPPDEARKILDFYNGNYGQGPIYFLDDFALQGNVLPLHWSVPRLTAKDAPPLVKGISVSETPLAPVNNAGGYPSASATFAWTGTPNSDSVWIPVPPGQNFYFGVRGSRTGTAEITMTRDKPNFNTFTNLITNPSMEATSGTVEVRRNYSTNAVPNTSADYSYSLGNEVSASTLVTGATDGPLPGVTRYIRRTVTTARTTPSAGGFYSYNRAPAAPAVGDNGVASVYVRSSSAIQMSLATSWRNDAGTVVGGAANGPTVTLVPNVWTRLEAPPVVSVGGSTNIGWWASVPSSTLLPDGATLDITGVLTEKSTVIGQYFDGSFSPDSDLTPAWTGAANASASVLTGVGVTGVSSANPERASRFSSTQWSASGNKSVRVVGTTTNSYASVLVPGLTVGRTYTVLGVIRLATAQTGPLYSQPRRFEIIGGDSAPVSYSSTAPNAAGVYEVRGTFVANRDSHQIRLYNGAAAGGGDVWWDNLALIEGNYTGPYFDGNTPNTSDTFYAWNGAPNASTTSTGSPADWGTGDPMPTSTTQRTNAMFTDPGGVTLKVTGSGSLTLNSMYASIGTEPPPDGNFRSGEGHTGVGFDGVPQRTGYSAVIGEGLESVSSAFKEVGAWR